MFGGWFAIIAVSYMVYRCAAANNRRRLLWVAISWVLIFGTGLAASMIASVIAIIRAGDLPPERELANALVVPVGIGMLVGAVVSVLLANRPANLQAHL
jgi:hypothetical protein